MIIGIVGAMELEIQLIKDNMTDIEEFVYAGFRFFSGKYKNVCIVLTSCGVGKVNAASCTQLLIAKFNVNYVINTGIAGSLNSNVKIGDIVISDNVTYHDVRKDQMIRLFPFREYFDCSEYLKEIAVKAFKLLTSIKCNYHIGRIVTGEAFVDQSSLKQLIVKEYNPHCVEMEGSAIGHVAYINDVPFLIIRSISDSADDNARVDYDEFESKVADNSASLVLCMMELMNNDII